MRKLQNLEERLMKRNLIIREGSSKVKVHKTYLQVFTPYEERVIGFKNIEALYLNKTIKISLSNCLKLMGHFPLFITDQHGTVLASFKEE